MKKRIILLFLIIISVFIIRSVLAKEVNVSIKDIEVLEKNNTEVDGKLEFDGLELKSNVKFYDVGDYIKYKVTLKNDDKKDYQIKDITDNNINENMTFEYDGKDKIIKAGKEESFIVTVTYTKHITNDITRLSNNIYGENQEVKISLKLNEYFSLINPTTGRNVILIILSLIMLVVVLDYVIKNKRVKTMVVILFLLLSVTKMVKADEPLLINFTIRQDSEVKINFLDRNWKDIDTGDFTKIEFVKIDKDKSDAYDISDAKDRSIIEWVDNGTLYIGSYHNVYAPSDSNYLFGTTQNFKMNDVNVLKFNGMLMTNYVLNMERMFMHCNNLKNLDLSAFNTSNVTNMHVMFYGCESLEELDLSCFDTSKLINMEAMFQNCYSLLTLNLDNWNFRELNRTGGGVLASCSSLKKISCRNWKLPENFTDWISRAWSGSGSPIEEIDVTGWDLSQTKNISGLFGSSNSLKKIVGLDTWDTSNITSMQTTFVYCPNLEELDLSSFDTSSVINMQAIFYGNRKLKTIVVSDKFVVSQLAEYGGMFGECSSLVGENGTVYDENHTGIEYARIDVSGSPGYFTKG